MRLEEQTGRDPATTAEDRKEVLRRKERERRSERQRQSIAIKKGAERPIPPKLRRAMEARVVSYSKRAKGLRVGARVDVSAALRTHRRSMEIGTGADSTGAKGKRRGGASGGGVGGKDKSVNDRRRQDAGRGAGSQPGRRRRSRGQKR